MIILSGGTVYCSDADVSEILTVSIPQADSIAKHQSKFYYILASCCTVLFNNFLG
jgi:hypothetical protein